MDIGTEVGVRGPPEAVDSGRELLPPLGEVSRIV